MPPGAHRAEHGCATDEVIAANEHQTNSADVPLVRLPQATPLAPATVEIK